MWVVDSSERHAGGGDQTDDHVVKLGNGNVGDLREKQSLGCSPFFGPLETGVLSENINTTTSIDLTASIDRPFIAGSAELFRRRISQ